MKRHNTDRYFVVGEGIRTFDEKHHPVCVRPSSTEELISFRFSRLGPKASNGALGESTLAALADAMTVAGAADDPGVPAGFTYLAQFVDHDITMDATKSIKLGDPVTVEQLVQGRSPALDLDSLYGFGPGVNPEFYSDGVRLRTGTTAPVPPTPATMQAHPGADLPRVGVGVTKRDRRAPLIPDARNDENLAVAQIHAAFIRFHNRVVEKLVGASIPSAVLFTQARDLVVRHYQWMVRHDFLPRIVDPAILDDVFTNGRKFFEVPPDYDATYPATNPYMCAKSGDASTVPIEFTVAAYRLGHSMIRDAYQWNVVFRNGGLFGTPGTLELLFRFSGTSGNLSPSDGVDDPDGGQFEQLPSNWIADFRRLFDFTEAGRADLVAPNDAGGTELNVAKRIDSLLVDPLKTLPLGSFGGRDTVPVPSGSELNLAFRNLTRGEMVELANGAQMADMLGVPRLSTDELLAGSGGAADLSTLNDAQRQALTENPPLWFYILREAEVRGGGKLAGVGARIVAEVFHRAIEGSRTSIVRDPAWTPTLGPAPGRFNMTDLLLEAFEGRADLLNPLGD